MNPKKESTIFHAVGKSFYHAASFVGLEVLAVIKNIYDAERKLSVFVAEKLTRPLQKLCTAAAQIPCRIGSAFASPFLMVARGVRLIRRNVASAAKIGPRFAVAAFFATLGGGIKRNGRIFKTALNYTAPVLGVVILAATVHVVASVPFMLEVRYNGQLLGYVENEDVYNSAMTMFQQRIVYGEGDDPFQAEPEFRLCAVSQGTPVGREALVDRMVELCAEDVVESNGIYIGEEFYGAVKSVDAIHAATEALLTQYRTGAANETVEFVNPVRIVEGLYLSKSVVPEEQILELIGSEVAGETTYTIQEGDTPSGVAKKNGVAYADFKAMNPNCETDFLIGDEVYLSKSVPFMQVRVTRRETRKKETAYQTETINDSSKSASYRKVTQKGVNGITEVTEDVEYVNGVEVARTEVSSKVLQNVVNQKIVQGTKVSTVATANGSTALKGMSFVWPLNGGYISSNYGWRGGRMHNGMDIAAPRGTEIYAAAGGTVEHAGWSSNGFGYNVIINHGNGVKTLYGHASRVLVKTGQKVDQGELIALVGNSGLSRGPSGGYHLHFEIRPNGKRINPKPYIT